MTDPRALRAHLNLSVAAMAQLVGVTRAGWYKIEHTGTASVPLARLLSYIERYGPELAREMMHAEMAARDAAKEEGWTRLER